MTHSMLNITYKVIDITNIIFLKRFFESESSLYRYLFANSVKRNIIVPRRIKDSTYIIPLVLIKICSDASKFAVKSIFKIMTIDKNKTPTPNMIFFNFSFSFIPTQRHLYRAYNTYPFEQLIRHVLLFQLFFHGQAQ